MDFKRKYPQGRENQGSWCREPHDWRAASAIRFLFLPSSLNTHPKTASPDRGRGVGRGGVESRMKAGLSMETPDHQNTVFFSGLGHHHQNWVPAGVDSCLKSSPRGEHGLQSRQSGSLNRKISKALISPLPMFKTSNADTLSTSRQPGHFIVLSAEYFSPVSLEPKIQP